LGRVWFPTAVFRRSMEESEQSSSIDVAGLPARFESLKPLIEQVAAEIYSTHNVKSFVVSISFLSDEGIARINQESLGRPGPTDVIAFDLSEDGLPLESVGDIYISIDTAIENSARFKVTPREEILRLAVHGLLHIIGYDDSDVTAREKMTEVQEGIVRRFSAGPAR
jgi:probable rRNA maturation factor